MLRTFIAGAESRDASSGMPVDAEAISFDQ